jgi:hypothetical protein
MLDPPRHDWSTHEAMTRRYDAERLRRMSPQERFAVYEDLYRLVTSGRSADPAWQRLQAWRWTQKVAIRRLQVTAFTKLDELHRERAAAEDTD